MRRNTKLSLFISIALAATTVTADVGNCRCVNRATMPSTGRQLEIANIVATQSCCSNEAKWMRSRSPTFHSDIISCTQSHDAISFDRWLSCCSNNGAVGICGSDIGPPQKLRRSIEARNYHEGATGGDGVAPGEDVATGSSSGGGGGGGGGGSAGDNIYANGEDGEAGESDLPPCPEEEPVPEGCEEEQEAAPVQGY